MPVQLNTKFCRATIVFDATGYTTEIKKSHDEIVKVPVVEAQYQAMFDPKEYWYLPESVFSPTDTENAPDVFIDLLRNRLEEHALTNTQYKLNLIFYFRLEDMPAKKADTLKNFIKRVVLLLAMPTMDFHTYIVASKYQQNNKKAMQNLDSLANRFLTTTDPYLPQLMLLEGLPLGKIDGPVRATARVANILSRDGSLYQYLQQKSTQHALWYWTMSEFDEDALKQITEELEELQHRLEDFGPFPKGELLNNLRAVQNREEQRNIGGCILRPENVPIPSGAIKRGLFGGKAADEVANMLANALRETYRFQYEKKCFPAYTDEEMFELCDIMTTNIPLNHWKNIVSEINEAIGEVRSAFEIPRLNLHSAGSVSAMQEQLGSQIKELSSRLKSYYPQHMAEILMENFEKYLKSDKVKNEERALRDRESDLKLRIQDNNGIREGTEYLAAVQNINKSQVSLSYLQIYETKDFLLISDRINAQWFEKYKQFLPSQINDERDVYNYMDLQEYEFQSLTLHTFRSEELEAGKTRMFKLEGLV